MMSDWFFARLGEVYRSTLMDIRTASDPGQRRRLA